MPHLTYCEKCAPIIEQSAGCCNCSYPFSICARCAIIWRMNPENEPNLHVIERLFDAYPGEPSSNLMEGFTYQECEVGIGLCAGSLLEGCPNFSNGEDDYVQAIRKGLQANGVVPYGDNYNAALPKMIQFRNDIHQQWREERLLWIKKRIASRRILRYLIARFGTALNLHDYLWQPGGVVMNKDCSKFNIKKND